LKAESSLRLFHKVLNILRNCLLAINLVNRLNIADVPGVIFVPITSGFASSSCPDVAQRFTQPKIGERKLVISECEVIELWFVTVRDPVRNQELKI
jgi:hypothetical protein